VPEVSRERAGVIFSGRNVHGYFDFCVAKAQNLSNYAEFIELLRDYWLQTKNCTACIYPCFVLFFLKEDVSFCDCTKDTEGSSGGLIGHAC
jgi:hypothetical protein